MVLVFSINQRKSERLVNSKGRYYKIYEKKSLIRFKRTNNFFPKFNVYNYL